MANFEDIEKFLTTVANSSSERTIDRLRAVELILELEKLRENQKWT